MNARSVTSIRVGTGMTPETPLSQEGSRPTSPELRNRGYGSSTSPESLLQGVITIWDRTAMYRAMNPYETGTERHVTVRPVEGAKPASWTDRHSKAPIIPYAKSRYRPDEITRPGRPIHWRIGRPPPGAVHQDRIVIGDINDLRVGRFNDDGLTLLIHPHLII